jgi:hypothetical protein
MPAKRVYRMTAILLLLTLLAFNLTPLNLLFKWSVDADYYTYSNYSGTVTVAEDWYKRKLISNLSAFERVNPACATRGFESDTTMYRLFRKNPLAFWRWKDYLTDKRFDLPYADWNEIEKRRRSYIDTIANTPCRDF